MATASAITSKNERASELRATVRMLDGEIQQLRKKLSHAAGNLAVLEDRRRAIAEEIADGKPQKSGSTEIHAKIAEARLPVEVLQKRVSEKETTLVQTREALAGLEREIATEAQQVVYQARFAELKKELIASGAVIAETLRRFIQEELPRFDAARDALTLEIVGGHFAQQTTSEGREARELLHRIMQEWTAGDAPAIRRKLLRANPAWQVRGDIRFEIENLRPPKQ